jgi:AraC family transcriptional regulator
VTASEWRSLDGAGRGRLGWSKDGQADGKAGEGLGTSAQDGGPGGGYPPGIQITEPRRKDMTKLKYSVEVKDLPELTVAYARHIGPYPKIGEAFERLGRWAGPRGLYAMPGATSLAVYHDSPEATEESKLRSSACVSVPPGTEVSGDINLMTVPGGKFAVAHFEIGQDEFGEAWDALMGEWFPSSGWQPDDRMCYELYLNDPDKHPEGKFIVDICEPVKPL